MRALPKGAFTAVLLLCLAATAPPAARANFGFAPGPEGFEVALNGEGGQPATQAGSHPVSFSASLAFNREPDTPYTEGDLRELDLELPPGLLENPTAVPTCSQAEFLTWRESPWEVSDSGESCPDRTQVGVLSVESSRGGGETRSFGVFNLAPPPGAPAEIGANPYGAPILFVPEIRQAGGDYGITLVSRGFPQLTDVSALTLTLWGAPWSVGHDEQRGNCLNESEPAFGWAKCSIGRPAKYPPLAYLTLPTACEGPLAFNARATSWEGQSDSAAAQLPAPEECSSLSFAPTAAAHLSDPRASSPSGYAFDIEADQTGFLQPARRAPSPLREARVQLPAGITINPAVGSGLRACAPAEYAAESAQSPPGAGCPNESKIGDFSVRTPIATEPIEGSLYLASPDENPFGSLIAVYLIAKSPERGFLVKVAGEIDADTQSGDLTATFHDLPQLPYSDLEIHFREGQRSPLATPAQCGPISTEVDFTPWRSGGSRRLSLGAQISAGIGGGPCPAGPAPFTPAVSGGSLNSAAGHYSPFYLHLTRSDAEQEIVSYSASFPLGLLGKLAGIPKCPDAAIAAAQAHSGIEELAHPSCPPDSKIGHTVAGYGVGSVPDYAPGGLYLAGPYRGSELSVVAIDSAVVGPFDLGTIVVRSAIRVDATTAQAQIDSTATDPIPHIRQGIPIHLRDVRVYVDRPQFTLNPTSCTASRIVSALNGSGESFATTADDTLATATAPYQAFDCGALGFRPRVAVTIKGGTTRGRHPALSVVVRPRSGDANIASASVALPPSLFLDQSHIKGICTQAQFAAHRCPADSAYGWARAWTPLLASPMEGPAYLRASGHTLPDLVFALRGEGFEIDPAGTIDSYKGRIRGSFADLPDAPVRRFELRMAAGKRGLIQNAANLCARPQRAIARLVGQARRGRVSYPVLGVHCKKHRKRHGHHRKQGRAHR